jgi:hypothetical protein
MGWIAIAAGGLVLLAISLLAGFWLGKQASHWCPQCGRTSLPATPAQRSTPRVAP